MPKKSADAKTAVGAEAPLAYRPPGAARAAGISLRAMQRLIATKQIRSFRCGRVRLIRRAALEQFLVDRETAANSEEGS